MKIELDTDKLKNICSVHPAMVWGVLTIGLIQFIILGMGGGFYSSFIPWAIFCFIKTLTYAD